MQIRIRDRVNPGYGIRDGERRIRDPAATVVTGHSLQERRLL
jgi:hypothetical protein